MPDVSLNGIEFTIKGSSDAASDSVKKLTQELTALKTALGKSAGINGFTNQIKKLENINTTMLSLTGTILKEISQLDFSNIQQAASGIKNIASAAKQVAGIKDVAPKTEPIQQATHSLKEFFSAQRLTGEGSNKFLYGLDSMRVGLLGLLGGVGKVSDGLLKVGVAGANAARKLIGFSLKNVLKNTVGFVKHLGGVISSFKRILMYRLIRSAIKEIGQAFNEGIKNLYGWSTLVGGKFATSMNQISTSLLYFKNSLGAAVAPIVNALAPAIDFLIDKIVALINIINQLFAKLTGASSWTAAKKKATEYGDAVSGAGGAAKEALKYLAPFDELNRLPDENKGGGGGGNSEDYSGMFEEMTQFNEGISDFAENVRTAIENGNWSGLGTYLGAKFNQLIDDIDWSGIGAKVGEKINAWFTTEFFTLKTVNFQNIGKSIAELLTGDDGIGGALRQIDFTNLGGIVAEKTMILPEIIVGAINQLDFGVVGESLGDIIKGFFNDMADQINKIDWGTTMSNLVTGIVDFIKGLDINGIVESILKLTGSIIGAVIEGIGPLLVDLADTLTSPDTWTLVTAWLADLPAKMKQAGISAINALGDPIIDGLNSLIEKINSSGLAKALGIEVEPIEFKLIPDIPKEELTKNYDKAKAEIEAQSKQKPSSLSANANIVSAKDDIPAKDKQIEATADYRHWAIKGAVDPAMSSKAYKDWTTWNSTLDYRHWAIKGTVDPKASSNAYKDWTTWDSVLNYNKWAIKGTVNPKGSSDVYKGWTTWDSTANFNKQKNSLGTPSIDSIANLIDYTLARAIQNGANQLVVSAVASIVSTVTGGGKASGGAYYGGSWHSIPQYASGGRPHGTMFWAGEAGPEVVGHVGGRTEVLNQSQLAATMYASVSAALSGLRFAMTAPAAPDGGMGGSDDALYNAFVRALESADFAVDNTINMDGDTVYRGVVRRNQQRRRQLGYNPMLT